MPDCLSCLLEGCTLSVIVSSKEKSYSRNKRRFSMPQKRWLAVISNNNKVGYHLQNWFHKLRLNSQSQRILRNRRKINYVCCAIGRQDPKNRRSDQRKGDKGRHDSRKTDKNKRKSQGWKHRRINLQIMTDSKQENCCAECGSFFIGNTVHLFGETGCHSRLLSSVHQGPVRPVQPP